MLFGLFAAHQSVWSAGGLFFVVVGVSALVLTIAPAAPGRPGALLRSPGLSVLLLAAVAASLCYAVMVALLRR
jgi:hypothetical protein